MTEQEAIRLIQILPTMCVFTDAYGEPIDSDAYYEAVEMAISALQAQDVPGTNDGDLISRQAAINETLSFLVEYCGAAFDEDMQNKLYQRLILLPSAQPETAKRIVGKSRDGMTFWYQCDMCNEPVDAQDNFCRGCGRRLTDG